MSLLASARFAPSADASAPCPPCPGCFVALQPVGSGRRGHWICLDCGTTMPRF